MARVEQSVVIERPVEEVWAYLNDCAHDPEWMSMITETEKLTDGPVGVGTVQRSAAKVLGRRIDTTFEITEHEPNRSSRIRPKSSPFPYTGTYEVAPVDGGTRFTWAIEGEPGSFFRLAEPLVVRMLARQLETDLATLKDLLEARA